jgi:hypothetical protein
MSGVDQQGRAFRANRWSDAAEINRAAVRPMHRRNRDHRERRDSAPLNRRQKRFGPIAVARPLHRFDCEAAGTRARHPFQHRGGMIILQDQHA